MPLYRRVNKAGYELFYNPRTSGWRPTHYMVAFGMEHGHGLVAHHVDFNKRNNAPSNLQKMTPAAHSLLHQETAAVLSKYARSDKGRNKSKELMSRLWADPVWAAAARERLRRTASSRGKSNIEKGGGFAGIDPDRLQQIRKEIGNRAIERLTRPENLKKAAEGFRRKLASDPEFLALRRELAARNSREGHRRKKEIQQAADNHKVSSVKSAKKSDVFDLSVEKYHNFALSSGVFAHNCFVGVDLEEGGILIDTWGMIGTMTQAAISQMQKPR